MTFAQLALTPESLPESWVASSKLGGESVARTLVPLLAVVEDDRMRS